MRVNKGDIGSLGNGSFGSKKNTRIPGLGFRVVITSSIHCGNGNCKGGALKLEFKKRT